MASVFLPASALVLLMLKLGKLPPRVFAVGLDVSELTLSSFLFPKLKMLDEDRVEELDREVAN